MSMFKNITIGQYIAGESLVHRLDPRTKIIAALCTIIVLFITRSFWGYGTIAAAVLLVIWNSKIPIRFFLRGIRPLLFIIIITFFLHMFMTDGEPLLQIGFFRVTWEGILRGGMMGSRLILLVMVTSSMTLTTSPISLTDGIESLLSPGKRIGVPAHELAMMMTIALRFIPTLLEETEKIMKAQMARGADFESGNIVQRARNMLPLLVPLFINSFRRADDLAVAMEARGYRGGQGRTKFKQLQFRFADGIALLLVFTLCFGVAIFLR